MKEIENTNKSIVKKYIEEVVNTGDLTKIESFISEDYVEIFQNTTYKLGIEGAKKHTIGVRETYPDLKITVENQIAEGDWVATCYTMKGTHMGNWMGIKPTGKQIVTTGVNIDKIKNGKIIEHGGAANLLHSLLEIGAIKINDK